jgi:hypothetical protein
LGLAAALLLTACRDEAATYRSDTGPVPATEQRPGDPDAGYTALVNAPYVSCGIPYDAFTRVVTEVDPTAAPRPGGPERGPALCLHGA